MSSPDSGDKGINRTIVDRINNITETIELGQWVTVTCGDRPMDPLSLDNGLIVPEQWAHCS